MSDSRNAANQERGTKNQEQPRSGSQLKLQLFVHLQLSKNPAVTTAGFFIPVTELSAFASLRESLSGLDERIVPDFNLPPSSLRHRRLCWISNFQIQYH